MSSTRCKDVNDLFAKTPVLQMITAPLEEIIRIRDATAKSALYWRETRQCTMFGMHSPVGFHRQKKLVCGTPPRSTKSDTFSIVEQMSGHTDFLAFTPHLLLLMLLFHHHHHHQHRHRRHRNRYHQHLQHIVVVILTYRKDRPSSSFIDTFVPTHIRRCCPPLVHIIS